MQPHNFVMIICNPSENRDSFVGLNKYILKDAIATGVATGVHNVQLVYLNLQGS